MSSWQERKHARWLNWQVASEVTWVARNFLEKHTQALHTRILDISTLTVQLWSHCLTAEATFLTVYCPWPRQDLPSHTRRLKSILGTLTATIWNLKYKLKAWTCWIATPLTDNSYPIAELKISHMEGRPDLFWWRGYSPHPHHMVDFSSKLIHVCSSIL